MNDEDELDYGVVIELSKDDSGAAHVRYYGMDEIGCQRVIQGIAASMDIADTAEHRVIN